VSRVAARPVVAGGKPEYSALLTRATDARAELRALRRTGSRAELEAVAARRVRLPAPIVTGGVKRGDENGVRRTGAVFGVSASLPLFDAGGREAARWDAERMRADAERTAIEQEIAAQIRSALDILAARRDAAATGIQEQGADLAAIAEIAYREGEIGIFELLDAVRASARARTRDIEMALDLRLAEIALERAVGDVLWP
jgi:outer membrane protein TolC